MQNGNARVSQSLAEIKPLLEEALRRLRERFPEELVAVALYGSYARGEAEPGSDADLLVVVRHLPHEWTDIFALEDHLMRIGPELGYRLDIRLVEPEAVSYSVTCAAPLMLEIYDARRVLYDPAGFFADQITRFGEVVRERGIYKISRWVWKVPAVAH